MASDAFFWLLLLAIAVPLPGSAIPASGNATNSMGRIFLGRETIHGEFEFVVRIQEGLTTSPWYKYYYQYCSGVVVHPQWILTSGPCGQNNINSTKALWVYTKCNYTTVVNPLPNTVCTNGVDPGTVLADTTYYVDEPQKWYHRQLVLIKLRTPLRKAGIVVRLANTTTDPYSRIKELKGFRVRIAGHGATTDFTNNVDDYHEKLKMAYMLIKDPKVCILPGTPGSDSHFICLESGYDGTTACFADVGGPIVYQDPINREPLVIGIMNDYGAGCYRNPLNQGLVFGNRVAPFRDRIQQIMGNDMLL